MTKVTGLSRKKYLSLAFIIFPAPPSVCPWVTTGAVWPLNPILDPCWLDILRWKKHRPHPPVLALAANRENLPKDYQKGRPVDDTMHVC